MLSDHLTLGPRQHRCGPLPPVEALVALMDQLGNIVALVTHSGPPIALVAQLGTLVALVDRSWSLVAKLAP